MTNYQFTVVIEPDENPYVEGIMLPKFSKGISSKSKPVKNTKPQKNKSYNPIIC